MVTPIWFTGPQLPPTNRKCRETYNRFSDDADDEIEDEDLIKKRVRGKKIKPVKKRKIDAKKDLDITEHENSSKNDELTVNSQSGDSEWEVSDFISSSESDEEWEP